MFKGIFRIINWAKKYKKQIYTGFLFSVLDSILAAAPLLVTGAMVSLVYKDMQGTYTLSFNEIYIAIAIILGSILLRWLCSYKRSRLQDNVAYMVSKEERLYAGEVLKRVPLGFFKKNKSGEITTVLTNELSFFEMFAMSMIDMVANSYLFTGIVVTFLLIFWPVLGLIAIISLLLSSLGLFFISKMLDNKAGIRQQAVADLADATIEYIRGMSIVKSYNQQGMATRAFSQACKAARKINISLEMLYVFPESLHRIALYLGSTAILLVVSLAITQGQISVEMWIVLSLYSFVLFIPVENANTATLVLGIVNTTLDNLEKISHAEFIDKDGTDIVLDAYDIKFDQVRFSYDNKEIIKGVSIDIPQNTTTALVGASGSGKTTLCNLIARFYDVDSGAILVGGRDVREFTCSSLLKNVTMVFQNVYLFNDTIAANICFGNPNATHQQMVDAAKKAMCHDFITALPDGYNTVVGEGGSSLSGGEKQRVSIARAMLKDAQIVILDEATASVDPENEYYIQKAIDELTYNKTVITIAHRLKTIQNADQIIVIDDGCVVQAGNHESLSRIDGKYKTYMQIRQGAESWSL